MGTINITAVSDLHGNLIPIAETDLLLIAGDVCPTSSHNVLFQQRWLEAIFKPWLRAIPAKYKVFIAGNHDFICEERPDVIRNMFAGEKDTYWLDDSGCECNGFKIWGSAFTPYFCGWAYNLYEKDLVAKWELIPEDTDILVVHGPPYGYGDKVDRLVEGETDNRVGSRSLLARIEKIKPKLAVYGHIHGGYGLYSMNDTILANVSLVNERYEPVNNSMTFSLDNAQTVDKIL